MRAAAQRIGIALALLALCAGFMPASAQDQPATPVSADSGSSAEFCTAEAIDKDNFESVLTPGQNAVVQPAANPDQVLYILQTVMPVGACLDFDGHRLHNGAVLWYVSSGEIELRIKPVDGYPEASLQIGTPTQSEDWQDAIQQEVGSLSATLGPNSWASADSVVNYSFRNSGDTEAVIIMTVLERPADPSATVGGWTLLANCKGNCRNPRR